jgi:CHAT domain-containing protein
VPLPERVLLAACGSAGSAGSGRGEWLGLGAGALLSGAQEVVATAWPIWDTAFTQGFDEQILSLLIGSDDIARDLRRLQLEQLAKWRVSAADHSNGMLVGRSEEPLPLIWASYQFLGARRI